VAWCRCPLSFIHCAIRAPLLYCTDFGCARGEESPYPHSAPLRVGCLEFGIAPTSARRSSSERMLCSAPLCSASPSHSRLSFPLSGHMSSQLFQSASLRCILWLVNVALLTPFQIDFHFHPLFVFVEVEASFAARQFLCPPRASHLKQRDHAKTYATAASFGGSSAGRGGGGSTFSAVGPLERSVLLCRASFYAIRKRSCLVDGSQMAD
jgi:hypothetical protein